MEPDRDQDQDPDPDQDPQDQVQGAVALPVLRPPKKIVRKERSFAQMLPNVDEIKDFINVFQSLPVLYNKQRLPQGGLEGGSEEDPGSQVADD